MTTEETDITPAGASRRDMLKKAAVAGAAVTWAAPAVQILGSGAAGAQTGPGSVCPGCIDITDFDQTNRNANGLVNLVAVTNSTCGTCNVVGPDASYAWDEDEVLNNLVVVGLLNDTVQYDIQNFAQPASVTFSVTATVVCRCATCQNNQSFTCFRRETASWNADGSAAGVTSNTSCPNCN
jgi:hypothetical protein